MSDAAASDCCSDCGKPRVESLRQKLTRGRCRNCYQRHVYALKKADAFQAVRPAPPMERLFSRVTPGRNGCIIWTGFVNKVTGYGHFSMGASKDGYAHRAAYELVKGEIPEGLVIDHACHNRDPECPGGVCIHHRCINPHHLEAVTQSENRRRSPHTKANCRPKKTHCSEGHEYTPENTRVNARTGARTCIVCQKRRDRAYLARRRAAAAKVA